jgi:hypothetical protein
MLSTQHLDTSKVNAMPAGRPTDFKKEYIEQAAKLCKLGATDLQIADFFGVNVVTIYRWKNTNQKFCNALKVAKEEADSQVERSLYQRALGFEHNAVKIFLPKGATEAVYVPYVEKVPPDTTACIFWLKNRKKEQWRDTQTLAGDPNNPLGVQLIHSIPQPDRGEK